MTINMDLNLKNMLIRLEKAIKVKLENQGMNDDRDYRISIINQGNRDFVRRTKLMKHKFDFNSIKGQLEYDLLTYYPYFLDVDSDGGVLYDNKSLDPTTKNRLRSDYGDSWQDVEAGEPSLYYLYAEKYMGIYVPADDVLPITVNALVRPYDMVNDEDYPFNGDMIFQEYFEAPLIYAKWKLSEDVATKEAQIDAQRYQQQYDSLIRMGTSEPKEEDNYNQGLRPLIYNRNRNR